jgi:large subunit ribosomal protein L18
VNERVAINRLKRKKKIRGRLEGTKERPRLSVFKSNRHLYVQLIDDSLEKTIAGTSTQSKVLRESFSGKCNKVVATELGKEVAKIAKENGIEHIAFDRNGFRYHGKLKAIADAARAAGLKF